MVAEESIKNNDKVIKDNTVCTIENEIIDYIDDDYESESDSEAQNEPPEVKKAPRLKYPDDFLRSPEENKNDKRFIEGFRELSADPSWECFLEMYLYWYTLPHTPRSEEGRAILRDMNIIWPPAN